MEAGDKRGGSASHPWGGQTARAGREQRAPVLAAAAVPRSEHSRRPSASRSALPRTGRARRLATCSVKSAREVGGSGRRVPHGSGPGAREEGPSPGATAGWASGGSGAAATGQPAAPACVLGDPQARAAPTAGPSRGLRAAAAAPCVSLATRAPSSPVGRRAPSRIRRQPAFG